MSFPATAHARADSATQTHTQTGGCDFFERAELHSVQGNGVAVVDRLLYSHRVGLQHRVSPRGGEKRGGESYAPERTPTPTHSHALPRPCRHNIAHAMSLLLEEAQASKQTPIAPVYYYTCSGTSLNVPYGDYIKFYREAHGVSGAWIPYPLAAWVISAYHTAAHSLPRWRCLEIFLALDYLLQVAAQEHTFNNT